MKWKSLFLLLKKRTVLKQKEKQISYCLKINAN
ncbi:hypothetical protein vBEcoMWL3_gp060c [Escherichia phage vB_EcoM_WL-3]|nr:hypothetical protein vBEcoMWL3_gp060c [Escherichia phage vB_EcoM_WL-3]